MLIRNFILLVAPCRRPTRGGRRLKGVMAALFRCAACHREGRKEEEEKGKESHHLVTKVLLFTTTFRRASRRADTHTHFFWQQVTLGIQWTFWEDLFFGTRHEIPGFSLVCFFFLSGRRDGGRAGRAGEGWKLGGGGGGGGEGGDTQLDGWMDGWTDGFYGGTSVVHILFLCRVFCVCFFFAESKREREREREGYPVAANSCQLQRRRLHVYNPPPPTIPNTHTHTHTLFTRV